MYSSSISVLIVLRWKTIEEATCVFLFLLDFPFSMMSSSKFFDFPRPSYFGRFHAAIGHSRVILIVAKEIPLVRFNDSRSDNLMKFEWIFSTQFKPIDFFIYFNILLPLRKGIILQCRRPYTAAALFLICPR